MISGLLAGAVQLGLAGLALRRLAIRLATGVAVIVFSLGTVLLAVGFAALAVFLSLDGMLPPFGAALVVAAGLLALGSLGLLAAWLYLRRGARRVAVGATPPLGGKADINTVHLALAALGAGIATGNVIFRRR